MENKLSVSLVPSESPAQLAELALEAEEFGYRRFTLSDSYVVDTFSILSTCATATKKILVGPSVTNPFVRHPGATAVAAATLDWISGGRAIQGVGAGRPQSMVFKHAGGGQVENSRPVEAVREAVTIMRELWSGETGSFRGKQFAYEGARLYLPGGPVRIPIFITSLGPAIERLAGEMVEIAMTGSTLISRENYQSHLANIREGARRAKREPGDPTTMVYLCVCCSQNGDLARESAKIFAAKHFLDYIERTKADPAAWGMTRGDLELMGSAIRRIPFNYAYNYFIPDELSMKVTTKIIDDFTIAGTPQECVEGVKKALSCGFDTGHLYLVPVLKHRDRYEGYRETLKGFSDAWLSGD